jgi:hypothetical protein
MIARVAVGMARAAHRDLEDADYILSTATMAEDGLFTDWYESWIGRLAGYRGCAELLRATVEAPTTVEGDFHSYGCQAAESRLRQTGRIPEPSASPGGGNLASASPTEWTRLPPGCVPKWTGKATARAATGCPGV